MKPFLVVLILAAFACAQDNATAPSQSVPVDQQNAQKARGLIDQAVQALGGSAYTGIQDISQEGRTYSFHLGRPNGVGTVFWRFYAYPDKERIELTKKRDVIYLENGNKGYEITFKGTREEDPKDQIDYQRRHHYALDLVLREWLHQPGTALFYDGHAVAEQKPAQQVTIMNAQNEALVLYLDDNTHLPIKKSFSWRDPTDKQRNVEDEVYDGYRSVQGVMTPFDVTRYFNGEMSNQRFLNSVKYNQSLNPSLFTASITYGSDTPPKR
jgi:hypothetical protein